MIKRYKYLIEGQIQGVGFRPFIYNLAKKLKLKGYIKNSNNGVIIEVEGLKNNLNFLQNSLNKDIPLLAKIDFIEKIELNPLYKGQFEIIKSEIQSSFFLKQVSIPPDIAICDKCKLDIQNTKEKYRTYFSVNCTNCGPRYSIIQTVPYD
jgi:hydrogenase maturation protein HypF